MSTGNLVIQLDNHRHYLGLIVQNTLAEGRLIVKIANSFKKKTMMLYFSLVSLSYIIHAIVVISKPVTFK